MFGIVGETIYERARGVDERPFISTLRFARVIDEEPVSSEEIIKSIGKQITFEKDTRDSEIIFGNFEKMIKEVHDELKENNFSFKTITVICRFQGFETHTKSKTLYTSFPKARVGLGPNFSQKFGHRALKNPTQDLGVLKKEAKKLLLRFMIENPKLIRLIGLRVKIC